MSALLAGVRPSEGRLVGLPWAVHAGPAPPAVALARAAIQAARSLAARRNVETLRDSAMVALAGGKVDRAVAELAEAAALAPTDAAVWSDLAAAHLQRAASAGDPYEYVPAFAAADRAVQRAPALLAAHFNRALALGRLSLHYAAAAEWGFLRAHERDPAWSREVGERAATFAAVGSDWDASLTGLKMAVQRGDDGKVLAIVRISPQRFREHVEEDLLPTWAKGGGSPASESLAMARAIAAALAAGHGDRLLADTVAQIDSLARNPRRLQTLIAGFKAYGEGVGHLKKGDFTAALRRFRAARELLLSQRTPFAGWATCQMAYCSYQLSDYPRARNLLSTLLRKHQQTRYRALRGRGLWLLGLVEGLEGSLSASLTAFESAVADFQSVEEGANLASLRGLLAYDLYILGQRAEAWRQLLLALIEPSNLNQSRARSLDTAAAIAQDQGDAEIALAFRDELLRSAEVTGTAYVVVEALRSRAAVLAVLGRKNQAFEDLARAHRRLKLVPDPAVRRSLEGDIWLVEGELAGAALPERSVAALDQAVQIFHDTSYHFQLGEALYARTLAELALGRNDDAERDLNAAIAESEQQRERIVSPEQRISFFDRMSGILDTMVSFQLEKRRRPDAALRFSEQAKARVLWDWLLTQPGGGPSPLRLGRSPVFAVDMTALERRLPEDTDVIEYAVLPRSTVLWLLRRGAEPRVATVPIGAAVLADLVQTLDRAVLDRRTSAVQETAAKLYNALVRPVADDLGFSKRLVFVPDEALHALPFALLFDPRTRRYLAQDHICSVTPSVRVLDSSLRRDEVLARRTDSRALVIADPDFDRAFFPSLPRLPAGETEASIAQTFPGSMVLRDRDATRRAFLRLAGGFEIVHFGGHSVVDAEFPLFSQIVLAKEPEDPARGVLYSGDILRQRFLRTRLVVLASCATAVGKISRTEGVENLARPFLAAGVPAVVASLWDVDDKATADFFARFYQNLRKSGDVTAALQATQIDLIKHHPSPAANPRVWAAFEVIGGSAPGGVK